VPFAQALSGRRISAGGSMIPLEPDRFHGCWEKVPPLEKGERVRLTPSMTEWHRTCADRFLAGLLVGTDSNYVDPRAALWHLGRAAEAADGPQDWHYWLAKGHAVAALGRYQDAIKCYEEAAAAAPNWVGHWLPLGVCYVQLGQWDEAAKSFQKGGALGYVAIVRLQQGDTEGYRKACAEIVRPGRPPIYGLGDTSLPLARICVLGADAVPAAALDRFLEQMDARQRDFNTLVETRSATPVNLRAALHCRSGRWEQAVQLLTAALGDETPAPAQDWFFLAIAQKKLGHDEKAAAALAKGVERLEKLKRERAKEDAGGTWRFWQERLEEQLQRREALALVRGNTP
jgi:tetratricopeptide (TPR) repeat protein